MTRINLRWIHDIIEHVSPIGAISDVDGAGASSEGGLNLSQWASPVGE